MDIKIKHIFHSGFEIKLDNIMVLIDVYTNLKVYHDEEIYCFVTHSHGDHYNPEIIKLKENNKITYIVSDDVPLETENLYKVKKGDLINVDEFEVKVFGTTDLGVSFLISYKGLNIFHSGDLNWWHWEKDDETSQLSEEKQYKDEIKLLIGHDADYAFVPVDHRLKSANRLAMDYFIKKIKPKYLIPMHFANEYDTIRNIKSESETILLTASEPNSYVK